ncbi:hypothetical protein [Hymenobacter sp. GOD-10R]|uniref:hypothetical protein n=1 Tax=Hymenobacter sp. GOD-10R TaxID=3093922 RepID=UPI002D7723F5|nr:hypothetical protein [Hymenobacter sp. GOD-10R]WRQ29658.1 hypothetical protein SD425_05205 [Hymenobacter sp. GOD-10R]
MKHPLLRMLALLLVGLPTWSLAQAPPTQPNRLELPLPAYASDVYVQTLAEDSSVVLLVNDEKSGAMHRQISFQKFDRKLKPVWSLPLEVAPEYEVVQLCTEGSMVYALFQSQYTPDHLWVASLDAHDGLLHSGAFETKISRTIYEAKALGGNLFVTTMVENHLTVMLLNLRAGTHQFLPAVYETLPTQFTFLADSVTKRAKFVMSQSNGQKTRLQVKQLAADGTLLKSEFVQAESERGLITAQISPGDSAANLLAGTYTLRDPRYSQGLFATDLSAGTTPTGSRKSLRFYDFMNLKHFFDFMQPARAARVRERGQRMKELDKQLRHHYNLLMHDLEPYQDGYVLVGEVYFPSSQSTSAFNNYYARSFSPYYANGYVPSYYPLNSSNNSSNSYLASQAIVCGFDRNGLLLWDNAFVLKDVRQTSLVETVRIRPLAGGNKFVMAYLKDEEVHYKIIDHSVASPNDLTVTLATSPNPESKEKPLDTNQEGLLPWYGSRFLAYGYQHVRVPHGQDRDVFFLNTIAFD